MFVTMTMTQTPWSQTVRQNSPNELATGPETHLLHVNENGLCQRCYLRWPARSTSQCDFLSHIDFCLSDSCEPTRWLSRTLRSTFFLFPENRKPQNVTRVWPCRRVWRLRFRFWTSRTLPGSKWITAEFFTSLKTIKPCLNLDQSGVCLIHLRD